MGKTQTIPLTQDYEVIVDDPLPEHLEWILYELWHAHHGSHGVYARNWKYGFLHKIIPNTRNGFESDHINRDTLDCRRVNLKNCRHKTNCMNRDMSRNGRPKKKRATR